jgi:hypothetical protein
MPWGFFFDEEGARLRACGHLPSPTPRYTRCDRWVGPVITCCLVGYCLVSTAVCQWIPDLGRVGSGDGAWPVAKSVLLFFGAILGIITGVLCVASLVRVCFVHPGRVWYSVGPPVVVQHNSSLNGHPTPSERASSASVEDTSPLVPTQPPGSSDLPPHTEPIPAPPPRQCNRCDRMKPNFAHHCRRCETCIDRMDHHCPWIGQCVGRENHKYFMLFLLYTSVTGFFITLTTMENFVNFVHEYLVLNHSSHHDGSGGNLFPPPQPNNGTLAPPSTSEPTAASDPSEEVNFVLVGAWVVATMFALLLSCFFGAVWSSALEGETQLDRRWIGWDGRPEPVDRRESPMRKYVMGRGSKLFWLVPTTPNFATDDLRIAQT